MKDRASFIEEMTEGKYLLEKPEDYEERIINKKWNENTPAMVEQLIGKFSNVEYKTEILHETFNQFLAENELGMGVVMPVLRVLITGRGAGPDMFETMAFLGKDESIARLQSGLEKLSNG